MRAAVLRQGQVLIRDDVEEPTPAMGQVLIEVKACGICGSDLHFAKHGPKMKALAEEMEGAMRLTDGLELDADVYLGHEFAGEILAVGPDTVAPAGVGEVVTSIPVLFGADGIHPIVYSNTVKGGYGERMLLSAPMLARVPNGLAATHAAMTEPLSVGLHAVNRSNIRQGEGALVIGCGPVGLAVIAALAVRGIDPIVAADYSPARRALAETMGAHTTVDPREETGWTAWTRAGAGRQLVVFEAVGVPGVINDILRSAPAQSRVVVVGVCMETDQINPFFGISKELNVQFVFGQSPDEFVQSLRSMAEGEIDVAPMITAEIPLDRVPWAFDALADPEEHCKIIITP